MREWVNDLKGTRNRVYVGVGGRSQEVFGVPEAIQIRYGPASSLVTQQATMLAAMDCFHWLGVEVLGLSLTFTIRGFATAKSARPSH
jgi:hypothetical protein